jgi:hypothetical protein
MFKEVTRPQDALLQRRRLAKSEMQRRSDPRRLRPTTPDGPVREQPAISKPETGVKCCLCVRGRSGHLPSERGGGLDDPRFDRRLKRCMVMYETITMEIAQLTKTLERKRSSRSS